MRTSRYIAIIAVIATIAGMVGCNNRPDRVPISGKVLIDGEPLTKGYIRFASENARPSGGRIEADGSFTLTCYDSGDGVVPGVHRIEVIAKKDLGTDAVMWYAPKKYTRFDTSGLSVEINEPTDSLIVELSFDGGKPFVEQSGK